MSNSQHHDHLARAVCLSMLLAQLVQNISSIETSIRAELPRDDLQSLCEGLDKELRFACVRQGVLAQSLANL